MTIKKDIEKRLRASVSIGAINGDRFERSICESQMLEAAKEIEKLRQQISSYESDSSSSRAERIMSPYELHEMCHEAMLECPQFGGWDDDQLFVHYGRFGDIPKKGIRHVFNFWNDESYLFETGYDDLLSDDAKTVIHKLKHG